MLWAWNPSQPCDERLKQYVVSTLVEGMMPSGSYRSCFPNEVIIPSMGWFHWLITGILGFKCTYPYKSHYIHIPWFSYGIPYGFPSAVKPHHFLRGFQSGQAFAVTSSGISATRAEWLGLMVATAVAPLTTKGGPFTIADTKWGPLDS